MKWILAVLLLGAVLGLTRFAHSAPGPDRTVNTWLNLIDQAEALHLPAGFLQEIDPDFVTVTFEDLRTYAAEYHPEDHRMILNLRLSFNKAGGALMDLERMTHHDVSLLYHELLHAYLDYIFNGPGPKKLSPQANRVLSFAREQMQCHYRFVRINPIRQRRDMMEIRFLSQEDSWEVLNETWAVFVGWQIWTKLEQQAKGIGPWTAPLIDAWATLLSEANTNGELLGYYEPDDPEERRVARKRFIAPSNGLTPKGAELLLNVVLEEPDAVVKKGGFVIRASKDAAAEALSCD
jgi:hypothetical protein